MEQLSTADYLLGLVTVVTLAASLTALIAIPLKVFLVHHIPSASAREVKEARAELVRAKQCIEAIDRLAYNSRTTETNLAYQVIDRISEWRRT